MRLKVAVGILASALAVVGVFAAGLRTLEVVRAIDSAVIVEKALKAAEDIRPLSETKPDAILIESRYQRHAVLMLFHVAPAFVFMLLGPFQFITRLRSRHIRLHRWSGRVFVASGMLVGTSAVVMPFRFPLISGTSETVPILAFGCFFLFALAKAFLHIRRRQVALHREWMIRAFGIGLGIAADRPVDTAFFVFTRLPLREHFAIALWISLCTLALAAEAWIRYTRGASRPLSLAARS